MLLPLEWLNDFIDIDTKQAEEIADKLLEYSCEIEEIIDKSKGLEKVVVGEIISINQHPNADKLTICPTNIGDKILQIVTGAKNINVGDKIPVALDGANLPTGLKIKSSKLRGELSEGMFCSKVELGIADSAEGVLSLDKNAKNGTSIIVHLRLDDKILDIGLTPNRGDMQSIKGCARELSVIYDKPIVKPEIYEENRTDTQDKLNIQIESENCSRYIGVVIKGVTIKPSPKWLQKRLQAVDIKPINNIVDITNYVMYELGQPLHAFDYKQIENTTIIIRQAKNNEKMVLLNDDELELKKEHLVIADPEKPIALAGIMGGKYSSIEDTTTDIIIESAYFNPVSIRKTAFALGLRTESSQRFEKGVDFPTVEQAIRRAIKLVTELAGGTITSKITDNCTVKADTITITLRPEKINQLLGTDISEASMKNILKKLGFEIKENLVVVPSFRENDVTREADLAEEIGRFYGYNNIKAVLPPISSFDQNNIPTSDHHFNNKIRDIFTGFGANEIVSYSMISPDEYPDIYDKTPLKLINPLSKSESILRSNLFISLIKNYVFNAKNLVSELKSFEIGHIYYLDDQEVKEEPRAAVLIAGSKNEAVFERAKEKVDYLYLKGLCEETLNSLSLQNLKFNSNTTFNFLHPYQATSIAVGGKIVAVCGMIHPLLAKQYGIKQPVGFFELFLDNVQYTKKKPNIYKPFSLFPVIKRDISFWIDKNVDYQKIISEIKKVKAEYLIDIKLADIYDGKKYGEDKINYALSLVFQSSKSTLNDDQVNTSFTKIISNIEKNLPIIFA